MKEGKGYRYERRKSTKSSGGKDTLENFLSKGQEKNQGKRAEGKFRRGGERVRRKKKDSEKRSPCRERSRSLTKTREKGGSKSSSKVRSLEEEGE